MGLQNELRAKCNFRHLFLLERRGEGGWQSLRELAAVPARGQGNPFLGRREPFFWALWGTPNRAARGAPRSDSADCRSFRR